MINQETPAQGTLCAGALKRMVASLIVWWIAAAGLVLGACGAVLGLTSSRRNRILEERLARIEVTARSAREREAQRPRLRAFVEQEVLVKWYLTIQNEGQGSAHNFTVSINGSSLEQSSMIDARQLDLTRLSVVEGRGTMRIPLQTAARPDQLQVELSWSDSAGELGLYLGELGSGRAAEAIEQP